MRHVLGPMVLVCLIATSANAGGLEIGAEEAEFNPCATPLPSRADYLKTVVGTDGDAVYDMQVKYHNWLCQNGAPLLAAMPPLISDRPPLDELADASDDTLLHFVFPGSSRPTPAPVPLPGAGGLLALGVAGLAIIRRRAKARR